jgi:hypothetical protein
MASTVDVEIKVDSGWRVLLVGRRRVHILVGSKDSSDERKKVAGAGCKSVCLLLDEIDFTAIDRSDTLGYLYFEKHGDPG